MLFIDLDYVPLFLLDHLIICRLFRIHVALDCHSTRLYYIQSVASLADNPESMSWTASQFGSAQTTLGGLNLGRFVTLIYVHCRLYFVIQFCYTCLLGLVDIDTIKLKPGHLSSIRTSSKRQITAVLSNRSIREWPSEYRRIQWVILV
jgi:hypothetical protein